MADRVVPVDVRAMVVSWPEDAPRGEVSRFCREHQISRSWFYELRARARASDPWAAMQPRSRPVSRSRLAIPVEIEDLAVAIRKELADQGWDHGPRTVRHQLRELGVAAPAASTLARVFSRRGMVVPQPQKRPRSAYRRFQFACVHECWQLDAFEWPLADGTTVAVLQLLDDHSRFLVGSLAATGETAEAAIAVVDQAIVAHQVPPLLLTDNGSAFNQTRLGRTSQLVTHLQRLGCRPITGRPRHPQTQGKDERVHATAQRWLRAQSPAEDLPQLQALLDRFDDYYNHHRPHQALGMRTPARALADDPHAIPPLPPTPEPTPPSNPRPTAKQHRVSTNGKVWVKTASIQLGTEHARTEVTVVLTGQHVSIFNARGSLIRSLTLQPGQTYYSNGRPRGRRPKPKPSTLN